MSDSFEKWLNEPIGPNGEQRRYILSIPRQHFAKTVWTDCEKAIKGKRISLSGVYLCE